MSFYDFLLLRGNATSFQLFFSSSLRAVISQKVERLIVCVKHDIKIARVSEKASESSLKSLSGERHMSAVGNDCAI